MLKFFVTHGLSLSHHTDNGPQFVSILRITYWKTILPRKTPLWPQTNGETEHQNRSILKNLWFAHAEGRDWKSNFDKFHVVYRNTPHTTTGVSPLQLLIGRKICTKLSDLFLLCRWPWSTQPRCETEEKGTLYSDKCRTAIESDFQTSAIKVLVQQDRKHKLSTPFNVETTIEVWGICHVLVNNSATWIFVYHICELTLVKCNLVVFYVLNIPQMSSRHNHTK